MQIDLSVKNVTKIFKEFVAVDNVSFEVPDGQFFSILGPSGCGKTTLLRMIAGLTEPTEGDIEIRGQSMLGIAPNKRPVNLIFQHLALFPMMNVKQNIAFGLKRRGEGKAAIEKKVDAILENLTKNSPQKIDYRRVFDVTICGDDVKYKKPAAEIYQKAITLVNKDVNKCIAIEDSYAGIMSAKASGLFCIALKNQFLGIEEIKIADYVVDSINDVVNLIRD